MMHSEVMIMARNQVRLDIEHREPFAGGGSFGNTGPYERWFGTAHFATLGVPFAVAVSADEV
jgi:hypothetical protein